MQDFEQLKPLSLNSTLSEEVAPLFTHIAAVIQQARQQVQQAVNSAMVQSYWQIGRLIVEHEQQGQARAAYGKQQLQTLSEQLSAEFGKGFDASNLRNMRSFYLCFPNCDALRHNLSWTHYRKLIRIENPAARDWYQREAAEQHWSARALERQIDKLYYERLLSSQDKAQVQAEAEQNIASLQQQEQLRPHDILRDPYILDFLNLPSQQFLESDLEQGLLDNLQAFLLELGKGFAFVARQQRVRTEDQDFYIDLVFYHFKLKCFLLIDLKLGKLTHQDVGQMDSYVRIYDRQQRAADDNPTIGLILCSRKSEAVVKYSVLTDSEQLFAAKYLPYLPSEAELKRELELERIKVQAQLLNKTDEAEDD
ncbi:putative nuclease of restriction endonuclease-like (RecB) superfamily [Methylobacter tundripaludum]|uniref:Putative nuclease of restriction endonuclease-like (RecB) superfamily n=1 Tax=Methylobacter tundripaludum TaxID=173365 RepID=A0A2S6HLN1_9GAMM|nr:PDDEXK nuclease domain-containing protein [Methylobacter tundripaludum]PPK78253.1 putative nuclease of restriction endonuclease-like (RecB) superfamily [Methylobacter tundripaludum]